MIPGEVPRPGGARRGADGPPDAGRRRGRGLHRQLRHAGPSRRRRARHRGHLPLPVRPAGAGPAACCARTDGTAPGRPGTGGWPPRRASSSPSTWSSGTTRSRPSAPASPPCSATCRWSFVGFLAWWLLGERPEPPAGRWPSRSSWSAWCSSPAWSGPAPTATTRRSASSSGCGTSLAYARVPAAAAAGLAATCGGSAGPLFDATAVAVPVCVAARRRSPAASTWCRRWPAHGWLVTLALTSQVVGLAADRGVAAPGAGGADLGRAAAAAGRLRRCSSAGVLDERPSPVQLLGLRDRPGRCRRRHRRSPPEPRTAGPSRRPARHRRRSPHEPDRPRHRPAAHHDRRRWARRRGRGPRRPGGVDRPGPRPPARTRRRRSSTRPGPAWCRASSTRTPTCSSPASAARSSSPGWPAPRTTAVASAPRSRRLRRPATASCSTSAAARAAAALAHGTTTMEVKTGYGLTVDSELRLLRLVGELPAARRSGWSRPTSARTSCPPGRDRDDYVDEVVATLPAAAAGRRPLVRRLLRRGRLHRRRRPAAS